MRSDLLARFVRAMAEAGELTKWSVALIGAMERDKTRTAAIGGHQISTLKRSHNKTIQDPYSIGTLISPRDQAIDLTKEQWDAALELTRKAWRGERESDDDPKKEPAEPGGPSIRRILGDGVPAKGLRHQRERGLLMLYLLDPKKAGNKHLDPDQPILAWAASLPGSPSARGLSDKDYMANTVEWEGFSDGLG